MTQKTIRCPICGDPYKFYAFSAADQSACPDCVRKAEEKMKHKHTQITWPIRGAHGALSTDSSRETGFGRLPFTPCTECDPRIETHPAHDNREHPQ